MKKVVVCVPHSHGWLYPQVSVSSLLKFPPLASGVESQIVVVDNGVGWSPAIRGITDTRLGEKVTVFDNPKGNKFHASALDAVIEHFDFDYLMAWETDVVALKHGWLQWFMDNLRDGGFDEGQTPPDYAASAWHHEQFCNPSCTLYRREVLDRMMDFCKNHPDPYTLRWGDRFSLTAPLDNNISDQRAAESVREWICGPFAEKRGWPEGTVLKEPPSGQFKGPSWYEPGQQLHHWAVNAGYTYTILPTATTEMGHHRVPTQTFYGITDPFGRNLEIHEMWGKAWTVHLWGGTRALDIIKHPVTDEFVKQYTKFWLEREARFWRDSVDPDLQKETIELIRKWGWHYRSQGGLEVTDRDREAARFVQDCYAGGQVFI